MRALGAALMLISVALTGCSGGTSGEDEAPRRDPTACGVLSDSDVAELLGVREVEAQDATSPLRGRGPLLGCRWEPSLGEDALRVTFTRAIDDGPPGEDVAAWRAACTTPVDVDLPGAVATTCADGAFARAGSELYARYDGEQGAMTMRLGVRRAQEPEPGDTALLTEVARRVQQRASAADYDRLVDGA